MRDKVKPLLLLVLKLIIFLFVTYMTFVYWSLVTMLLYVIFIVIWKTRIEKL